MTNSPAITRAFYAVAALSVLALTLAVSGSLISNAMDASTTTESPKVNSDIHSQVAHRAVSEQLLFMGEPTSGYIGTTLRMLSVTSDDSDTLFTDSSPYIGEITAISGNRYAVELELLTAGDEVIPLFVNLTLIEDETL